MRRRINRLVIGLLLGLGLFAAGRELGLSQQPQQAQENYLVISKFNIAQDRAWEDAIAEASQWVRDLRASGEFNSVRLYLHAWGPDVALYLVMEPKSWQAIETGYDKLRAAHPDIMTSPWRWGDHSDNIVTEIPVQ